MIPRTPAQALLYSTVKLTTKISDRISGSGTGFFYKIALDPPFASFLIVTNKHVIDGADTVTLSCHVRGKSEDGREIPTGEIVDCHIELSTAGVIYHSNKDIDLCAIPFNGCIDGAERAGRPLFMVPASADIIPRIEVLENFDAIEEVIMVGCPNGLSDELHCFPLIRSGKTASPISVRHNGKSEFMVDMACFPGSSGSPVFIYDRNGYTENNTYIVGNSRLVFAGILYSGPITTASGEVILNRGPAVAVDSMMHLGYVIRSTEMHDIEQQLRKLANAT